MSAYWPISSALPPTADVVWTARLGLLLTLSRSRDQLFEATRPDFTPPPLYEALRDPPAIALDESIAGDRLVSIDVAA